MKAKKKTVVIITLSLLLTAALCGTVFAYMFARSQTEENSFVPANVACTVSETFNGTAKSSITVKNTGNVAAYLRVRLVTYWVDGDGNIVGKASASLDISPASGWISGDGNIYYYSSPVEPGNSTPNLLASSITLAEEDGYKQVVEVFAEAIQSKPAGAVTESWGVSIDGSGKITG